MLLYSGILNRLGCLEVVCSYVCMYVLINRKREGGRENDRLLEFEAGFMYMYIHTTFFFFFSFFFFLFSLDGYVLRYLGIYSLPHVLSYNRV